MDRKSLAALALAFASGVILTAATSGNPAPALNLTTPAQANTVFQIERTGGRHEFWTASANGTTLTFWRFDTLLPTSTEPPKLLDSRVYRAQ